MYPSQVIVPTTPPLSPSDPVPASIFQVLNSGSTVCNSTPATEASHAEGRSEAKRRIMILCFDGTGNKFGKNSNVVRFFRALEKDKRDEQIVYYQPGIGTYNKHSFYTRTGSVIASVMDFAVAWDLDDHVKQGYQFIVQNYRPHDRICIFGFSRGAHTARVVAGMVYKVGILPKENIQQVDFAFSIYNTTGYNGYKLSQEFKRTFTSSSTNNVSVDFVGVWDTVSSVGIIPKAHPYTSVNFAVKHFRHALSLDERRARFRPNVWSEMTLLREHELDVDIPIPDDKIVSDRDTFDYKPPDRNFADVKEVWFAGTHADVGGGSHDSKYLNSLSYIPLRWMIEESIVCGTGIIFDLDYLRDHLDFDFGALFQKVDQVVKDKVIEAGRIKQYRELEYRAQQEQAHKNVEIQITANGDTHTHDNKQSGSLKQRLSRRAHDIVAKIFDQLVLAWWFWWFLELIPMLYTFQDLKGNWARRRMRNFGRGRYLPVDKNGKVLVHHTVEERIRKHNGEKITGFFAVLKDRLYDRDAYYPRAHNWTHLQEHKMIEYVD